MLVLSGTAGCQPRSLAALLAAAAPMMSPGRRGPTTVLIGVWSAVVVAVMSSPMVVPVSVPMLKTRYGVAAVIASNWLMASWWAWARSVMSMKSRRGVPSRVSQSLPAMVNYGAVCGCVEEVLQNVFGCVW